MSPENRGMKNSKNQYRITINNKHISERLVELGCGKAKTSILKFPTNEQVPQYLIQHFVRGYFDGDGSVSNGKWFKIDIISTSEFLSDLQCILKESININITKLNYSRKYSKEVNIVTLNIGGRLQCIRFKEWLYKDATIFLERKKKVFDTKYINEIKDRLK